MRGRYNCCCTEALRRNSRETDAGERLSSPAMLRIDSPRQIFSCIRSRSSIEKCLYFITSLVYEVLHLLVELKSCGDSMVCSDLIIKKYKGKAGFKDDDTLRGGVIYNEISAVLDSRDKKDTRVRTRRCMDCRYIFKSIEAVAFNKERATING